MKLQWKFKSCVFFCAFLGVVFEVNYCSNTEDSQTGSTDLWGLCSIHDLSVRILESCCAFNYVLIVKINLSIICIICTTIL